MCSWSRSCGALLSLLLALPGALRAAEPAPRAPLPNGQPSAPADTRSREQLFRDVFGRPPPAIPVSAYVLLSLDGGAPQKVRAVLSPDERQVGVDGRSVIDLLAGQGQPEVVRRLEQAVDAEGWLRRDVLEANGIATTFHPRRFELGLATDPSIRGRSVRYLSGAPPSTARALRPAALAAFVNLNARAAEVEETAGATDRRYTRAAIAADGALNVHGVVLEGSGYAQARDGRGLQRGDARLVYDRPQQALRYSAGDLRYPVVGYQTTVDMGGIGVARDYSLQPYLRNYQSSQFEFYLERPAEVRIWVNDSLVSTLRLPAGLHDLRGLSPVVGLNATRLVIEDISGRIQTLNFDFIYSPTLLEPGVNVYSLQAGFRRRVEDGRYRYDSGDPVLSLSYLEGFRRDLTFGGYWQSDRNDAVAGLHAVHALATSTLQLDAAVRRSSGGATGTGARLDWTYLGPGGGVRSVQGQLGVEYLGARFGTLLDAVQFTRERVNFFGTVAVPLGNADTLHAALLYTPARDGSRRDAHNASASWIRRAGAWTFTLGARHRRTSRGEADHGVFFGLTYTFSDGRNNFYAAREPATGALAAAWSSTRPSMQSSPYGFASARHSGEADEMLAGAGYWTHQGLVEASHGRSRTDHEGVRITRNETAVRVQGAVVMADGRLGLAPQVAENFAIVRGRHGLADVPIEVDPDGHGGSRARSAGWSPAVVPDLGSYLVREVRVAPVDPPFGATPDKLGYVLAAAYKSGILLELGEEPRILAIGRLVDAKGEALAHQPLEVRRLGQPAEPIRTFTSRSGGFQLTAMLPGRYEITPTGPQPWNTIIVDIPATPDGVFRFGNLPASR